MSPFPLRKQRRTPKVFSFFFIVLSLFPLEVIQRLSYFDELIANVEAGWEKSEVESSE